MTPPRRWWRHAVGSLKDQRSLCVTRLAVPWRHSGGNSNLEAAVIQATSHDEQPGNEKHAGRVFASARSSPAFLDVIMQALARRVARTRSWPVALKALMLAHGLLFCSATAATSYGRLPFDLSGFRDRSAKPPKAQGFSTFIQAYFHFLNYRYTLSEELHRGGPHYSLESLKTMQRLLDLMMQIKPTPDIKTGLILEAMDSVVLDIFEVYSGICSGIASFLVGVIGLSSKWRREEQESRRALLGIKLLRKTGEQCSQLTAYFDMCRELGILNTTEFPPVERIPEADIRELEKMVMSGRGNGVIEEEKRNVLERSKTKVTEKWEEEKRNVLEHSKTVVTEKWELFEDDTEVRREYFGNPFVSSSWEKVPFQTRAAPLENKNRIERALRENHCSLSNCNTSLH